MTNNQEVANANYIIKNVCVGVVDQRGAGGGAVKSTGVNSNNGKM